MEQVLSAAQPLGLANIEPVILSDGGNFIVHLAPYPIVARMVKLVGGRSSDRCRDISAREMRVASHLRNHGVPAIRPSADVDAGPHKAGETWMTLWEYIPADPTQQLAPEQAVGMVRRLSAAMERFAEPLPILGVWQGTRGLAQQLRTRTPSDPRIISLLESFDEIDRHMQRMKPGELVPAHGDAHARNLLAAADGWLWIDFEDVSLMPAYWDLASYVGNLALFHGLQHPVLKYMLHHPGIVTDRRAFAFALSARTLMSTVGNLALALGGDGDLPFATRQLELCGDFLTQVDQNV